MRFKICAALLVLLAVIVVDHGAEPPIALAAQEKILFLHLRREAGAVTLLSATTRPGHLKPQLHKGPLQFEMIDRDGSILQAGEIKDPAVERLEYEDPNEPGRVRTLEQRHENAEFTLRVPFRSAARTVRFFLKEPSPPGKISAQAQRTSLGEINLPAELLQ